MFFPKSANFINNYPLSTILHSADVVETRRVVEYALIAANQL